MKPILFKRKNKKIEIADMNWINKNDTLPYVISLTIKIINEHFQSLGDKYIKEYIYNDIDKKYTCIYQLTLKDINEIINNHEKFKIFSNLFKIVSFQVIPESFRNDFNIIELVIKVNNISEKKLKDIEILFKLYSS